MGKIDMLDVGVGLMMVGVVLYSIGTIGLLFT